MSYTAKLRLPNPQPGGVPCHNGLQLLDAFWRFRSQRVTRGCHVEDGVDQSAAVARRSLRSRENSSKAAISIVQDPESCSSMPEVLDSFARVVARFLGNAQPMPVPRADRGQALPVAHHLRVRGQRLATQEIACRTTGARSWSASR